MEGPFSQVVGERADAVAAAAVERARAEQLQHQVDSLGALAASVEQALQARHKPNADPSRKRTGAPSKSHARRGQGRPAKARSGLVHWWPKCRARETG